MSSSESPITPSVLAWMLTEDGRTVDQVAEDIDVASHDIKAWVDGERLPTAGQLSKLAESLSRPRSAFFLPRPPEMLSRPPAFRRATGSTSLLSAGARKAVRDSRQIQKAIIWLRSEAESVLLPTHHKQPALAAGAVRDWLGIDDSETWPDPWAALNWWRGRLEAKGILVFSLAIGAGDIRGFSLPDDDAPVVGLNSTNNSPSVRIFTMAHELGHLVRGDSSTCLSYDTKAAQSSSLERWCEEFASNLLMPRREVLRLVALEGDERAGVEEVRKLSSRFRVSARAAAVRLIALGLASSDLYAIVESVFQVSNKSKTSGGSGTPRPDMRMRQYGQSVVLSILNGLPPVDALTTLRMEAADARELGNQFRGMIDGY